MLEQAQLQSALLASALESERSTRVIARERARDSAAIGNVQAAQLVHRHCFFVTPLLSPCTTDEIVGSGGGSSSASGSISEVR